jgi:hypothetical protein
MVAGSWPALDDPLLSFTSTTWAAAMQRFLPSGRATRTSAGGRYRVSPGIAAT